MRGELAGEWTHVYEGPRPCTAHLKLSQRHYSPVEVVKELVAQSCLTLGDPTDWSLPGSSVQGILQVMLQYKKKS